jgi:hypothetical protein
MLLIENSSFLLKRFVSVQEVLLYLWQTDKNYLIVFLYIKQNDQYHSD